VRLPCDFYCGGGCDVEEGERALSQLVDGFWRAVLQ
jgi:hypothetical protein